MDLVSFFSPIVQRTSIMQWLGYVCMGCERTCEATCSFCSHLQCCPKNRPSPLFLSYTVLVNLPLLALAIATGVHAFIKKVIDRPGCGYFIHPGIWLLVAAALSTFYILFAIRIYHTFSKPPTVDPTATSYSQHTRNQFVQKLQFTACHDVGVFLYLLVAPFTVVWAFLGLAKDGLDECGSSRWAVPVISALLLFYLLFTIVVALISCCWEVGRLSDQVLSQPPAAHSGYTQQHHQHGPSNVLQHVFSPGFHHAHGYPGTSAAPPPYAQAPPVAQMAAPHPSGSSAYPSPVPLGGKIASPAGPQPGTAPPPAANAPTNQTHGIFNKMAHAYKK